MSNSPKYTLCSSTRESDVSGSESSRGAVGSTLSTVHVRVSDAPVLAGSVTVALRA